MVYEWRDGFKPDIDPDIAGGELERIRDRDGKLETAVVVEEARPNDAPLHPAFEWNNKVAAESYRLWQARHLIRSLVVVAEEQAESTPVFVHVRAAGDEPGYYQSVEVAAQNPDEWARAIGEATSKAEAAVRALDMLRRLSHGKGRKTISLIKKAGAALGDAKAAIEQLNG